QDKLIENSFNITRYGTKFGNHILTAAGNIVMTGVHESINLNDRDLLVTKVDTSLNLIWDLLYEDVSEPLASSNVLELADSSLLLVTQRHNSNLIILVKISQQGQITDTTYVTVGSTTYSTSLKSSFLLPDSSLIYAGVNFIAKI